MNDTQNTGPPAETHGQRIPSRYGTYFLVSKVAYLIGVPRRIFESKHEPPKLEIYEELEKNRHARIVRNLCRLRTAIEANFRRINAGMVRDFKNLYSLPELIPQECITQLAQDGVSIIKANYTLAQYIVDINRLIMDRINNCKEVFPLWLNWSYLKNLFIMPNGLKKEGTQAAAALYHEFRDFYPYQMYINWAPTYEGNILLSDKRFVTLLYRWNQDEFTDFSKVSEAGDRTKGFIYQFLRESSRTVIVVDCENSDPYRFCAALRALNSEAVEKIVKIILYDDVHSSSAWRILNAYTEIPIEHILIERIKQNKSLVDMSLAAGTCREFYQNHVDSFVLVSSDSDYWGLIGALPEARFLAMVERENCGANFKTALMEAGIYYCYLDDFYSGDCEDIKVNALVQETYHYLERALHLNVNSMMDQVCHTTRVDMAPDEKQRFYQKFIRPMHLVIAEDGTVSIKLQS
ncbi:MAG: NYN domain-containing protein [Clostridiales bacterium]|nr:NYN domain-containing protein [Clostridiales bacterium]